jgi:putative restriction endonuclease
MAKYTFGEIAGLSEGTHFNDRAALREAGVHLALVAGIDGNPKIGASSIVLNGGYIDDLDLGKEILYTGHGGNDPNSKRQIADQSWDASGNKALIVSELKGLPIRVTRGYKHKSTFSPLTGYQYGGLYRVTNHFEDIGRDGYKICRYRLEKMTEFDFAQDIEKDGKELPKGKKYTERIQTSTLRIVRDTDLSKKIKELYDFRCQICGTRISVRDVPYAEAAHIRPLGKPHDGADKPGNIICLCPNHHVMFDKGVFTINDDFSLIGISGELFVNNKHFIDRENLMYHREHIFIND